MRAVRFGSYSIPMTVGLDSALAALEVDDAVLLLVTAADVAAGDPAAAVASAGFFLGLDAGSSRAWTW